MSNDVNTDLPRLIREVKAAGYRINNLFHRADGQCQANLRSNTVGALVFAWAYGPCFADALEKALAKAKAGQTAPLSPVGDDDRDPRKLGDLTEVTRPIHPGELLPGQEGTVAAVDPAAPTPVVEDDEEDVLI